MDRSAVIIRFFFFVLFIVGVLIFSPGQILAQEHMGAVGEKPLDEAVKDAGILIVTLASIILALLVVVAYKLKHTNEKTKKLLFFSMSGIIVMTTLFLVFSTMYVNSRSSSKGPVHWHADIEIWACGKERELKDPKGWSNKIGTATLHEHNDKRIHVEGVVMEPEGVSLGSFFDVIGGRLTQNELVVPEEHGEVTFANGGTCPGGEQAEVQVFVYSVTNDTYSQQKLTYPELYMMSPYGTIPPGDCVIIEYDTPKSQTDKLCKSYEVAEKIGKIQKLEL